VQITLHKVHVTQDGDSGKHDRGELAFAWAVGDDLVGVRDMERMDPGTEIGFGEHRTYTIHNATGLLPTVRVAAFEYDGDGLVEFCSLGAGVPHQSGSNGNCDVKWNVAATGFLFAGGLGGLDDCGDQRPDGTADEGCTILHSEDHNSDYPEFWAVATFRVID
jgi:hypothetical protein